ncbi:MAG: hypothetical protein JWQ68_1396 [Cryobacterium sp.]|jgi:hypothetical protein|nr:hypothetical protein [Cryobacterium sp.]HEV7949037.1 hypothetical protein [Glaciihabitans sp.]
MTALLSLHLLAYLYWVLLLLVTVGSLVFAALAFKLHKPKFATISAGALTVGLVIAAVPVSDSPIGFQIVLGLLGLALAVVGGGPMALLALRLATQNTVPQGIHGGILVTDDRRDEATPDGATVRASTPVHEVLRGGMTIGFLERLAVAGAIVAGFPEAIAVVVAIKGVGRFTELAAAEARERFIIGTFASLIWACACAALVTIAST